MSEAMAPRSLPSLRFPQHQPLFAFARIRSIEPPSLTLMAALTIATLALAWLSWKFVEEPMRRPSRMPLKIFAPTVAIATAVIVAGGTVLYLRQGEPGRVFPGVNGDDLYIAYNERIRSYGIDEFPKNQNENVLVVGNSFARDVANALLEGGFLENRNLGYKSTPSEGCEETFDEVTYRALVEQSDYIVTAGLTENCTAKLIDISTQLGKMSLAVGPKHFGYNLNPFITVPFSERNSARATPIASVLQENRDLASKIDPAHYLDLIKALGGDGLTLPVFDKDGYMLSQDRMHFTRFGAKFAAPIIVEAMQALKKG